MARRLIIEADGGSRGNPGPAAYGAVVRDADTGEVLAELSEHIGVATNNVAEYRGLIAALGAVRKIDPAADIEVRMDSRLVIEQMAGRWKIKHPGLRPLAVEARRLLPSGDIGWVWVPRERNKWADRLLNEALDAAGDRSPRPPAVLQEQREPSMPDNVAVDWGGQRLAGTHLLLLRHAETNLTADRRFSGSTGADPSLSDGGRRQAEQLAELLAQRGDVDAVVASPLKRCVETAAAIARRLGLETRTDEGWREVAFGDWEGHTFAEVQERWSAELARWLASTSVAPPGGESFAELARRVGVARDKTLARYPGRTVAVVTHGSPVKSLVRQALGAPPDAIFRLTVDPASVTEISYYPDGACSLRTFNARTP